MQYLLRMQCAPNTIQSLSLVNTASIAPNLFSIASSASASPGALKIVSTSIIIGLGEVDLWNVGVPDASESQMLR